jgi:hypothetical protein
MTTNAARTIFDPVWVTMNAERLRECFPEHWTPLRDLNAIAVGERLRSAGITFTGERELVGILATLQYVGIMHIAIGRAPFDGRDIDIVRRGALDVGKLGTRTPGGVAGPSTP